MREPLLDRTGVLQYRAPTKALDPIPAYDPSFDAGLDAVMLARARQLWGLARAKGRRIEVWYDGGLGSRVCRRSCTSAPRIRFASSEPRHAGWPPSVHRATLELREPRPWLPTALAASLPAGRGSRSAYARGEKDVRLGRGGKHPSAPAPVHAQHEHERVLRM